VKVCVGLSIVGGVLTYTGKDQTAPAKVEVLFLVVPKFSLRSVVQQHTELTLVESLANKSSSDDMR
jgi:hypothetical protein